MMTRRLGLVGLFALAALPFALPLASQASPSRALQTHRVMLGVIDPDPAAFDRLTGHHHSLHLSFSWATPGLLANDAAAGRTSVITLSPSGLSSAAIAKGAADSTLVEQAQIMNDFGGAVWVRPMPEMNGHWSPWCAVSTGGRSRGAAYSARAFVRAFRRIAIIMRGGSSAELNGKLAQAGLPPLGAGTLTGAANSSGAASGTSASGRVKLLWNPQGEGSPNVKGNRPRDYWPGAAYVDYVGNDLYEIGGKASWSAMDALYGAFRKPYVVAEWAPWGYDSPRFADHMFSWARSHARTIGLIYFNRGWSHGGSTFLLATKPRTLVVYRREARWVVFKSG
ncbi:MAG: hypothetical protein ABSC51_10580 [Gaiellaceae bacterium]